MNGEDWIKTFISRLLNISNAQWALRNFSLHDPTRGYLRLRERRDVIREMEKLLDVPPEEIPAESRFLLDIDYTTLYRASFERQSHWVCAMQAARRAGRRTALVQSRRGAAARRRENRKPATRTIDTSEVERLIREETSLVSRATRRRPHPAAMEATNPTGKRQRKPD